MRRDLDSSYVRLVSRWQEEDRRERDRRESAHVQAVMDRIGAAVMAGLFVVTMVIAYVGGV